MPISLPGLDRRGLDRRRFLAGSLAAAVAPLAARGLEAREPTVDPSLWFLWSDVHIAERLDQIAHNVNMADHFRQATEDALSLGERPAGLLVGGDCAYHTGQSGDYRTLVELLRPLTDAGVDAHLALGNHDNRERFWTELPGERGKLPVVDDETLEKHVGVVEGRDVDWILLDSLQDTDVTPGRLGERQREWLAKKLDERDTPAVVVAHHNPTTTPIGGGLMDTVALFEILDPRKRVKAYIFGHTHHWKVTERNGIHLVNLPAVAYPFVANDPVGWVLARMTGDGMDLELRSLDRLHARHGERVKLKWRV